jgi:hypothetical protein
METATFLANERRGIVDAAAARLQRSHVGHYEYAARQELVRRLDDLFGLLIDASARRNAGPIVEQAQHLAEKRFNAGYDLSEVQAAFNALEEVTWSSMVARLDPAELADSLGLVSSIFGAAKDALARQYVVLASKARSPALDVDALLAGSSGN